MPDPRAAQPPIKSVVHVAKMTGLAGMEQHLLTLLPGLRGRGLDVRLLILVEPGKGMDDYAGQMEALGIPTRQIPIHRDLDWPLVDRLAKVFRADRPDAVHTHLIHADWHGVMAARRTGIKAIFSTGHNDDPFRRRLMIRLGQRWVWSRLTHGIAISDAVRRFQIAVEGASADRVTTVYYGFDPPSEPADDTSEMIRHELGLPLQSPVFGSVCRLIEQKGIDDSLRAFWQVSRELPDAHYVIVGEGAQRAALEAQVAGYNLSHRVHFLGWRDDARSLMAAFDALVVPSRWEGFGLVVLEAMAARLPVIAARVSALPEIVVESETGYLIPPGDVQALAQAMLTLSRYPAAANEMGEAARKRLETEFTVARMVARTLDIYNPSAFAS